MYEVSHNQTYELSQNFKLKILAADNCMPHICGKQFACEKEKEQLGSDGIDSMSLFYDQSYSILNITPRNK